MPKYLYRCPYCLDERYVVHKADDPRTVFCASCEAAMARKPQAIRITWNGNKPSDGGVTPLVEHMIADAPRQRDELAMKKELQDGNG